MSLNKSKKAFSGVIAGAAATSLVLTGAGVLEGEEPIAPTSDATIVIASQNETAPANELVQLDQVIGTFSATQDEITPTATITKLFGGESYSLCTDTLRGAANTLLTKDDVMEWEIKITGDVDQEYTTTMAEVAKKSQVKKRIGCTCAGNPADGLASVNAETTGVSLKAMVMQADIRDSANAVTFISADGYKTTIPLWSLFTQPALIAYQINGEPLYQTLGCANQVWLGSASANYFARDVVEIRVESLAKTPEAPADGVNLPNVAVTFGNKFA